MPRADGIAPLEFIQLLAAPHRWQLLLELTRSDRRVGELAELLGEPQNLVSYHLSELRKAGLVSARRSSADGRDTYYRAELRRCAELMASAGAALRPGLRLAAAAPERLDFAGTRAPKVLFLCTGNSARSQMAEALLEHRSGGRIRARSAGSHPRTLHPEAVRVMAERGIDISARKPKHLRRFVHASFDRVITLCDRVREVCPGFPGHPIAAHWSIADPAAAEADMRLVFERTADDIEERIELLIAQMTEEKRRAS